VAIFGSTPEKRAKKAKKLARRETIGNISMGVLIGMIQYSFFALFFSFLLFPMLIR